MSSHKTILVLENNDVEYFLKKELLRNHNIVLLRAFNFAGMFEILNELVVDMVLVDFGQTLNDEAIDLTEKIKTIEANLPVVVISTNTSPKSIIECFSAGCDDYLVKPFTSNEFYKMITKHCAVENQIFV